MSEPPLAQLTTMRVGGPAQQMYRVTSEDELVEAIREVDDRGIPLLVLSGGSNLVISDAGFDGAVVQVATRGIEVVSDDAQGGVMVTVAAGEPWDDLVAHAVEHSWSGIEALSGIPGCTGATPVQNVGAYGQEVSQTIAQVTVYDRAEARVRTFTNADCAFAYRSSLLKTSVQHSGDPTPGYVVLSVTFHLRATSQSAPIRYADLAAGLGVAAGQRVPLREARAGVLEQRRRRGMVLDPADHDTWSCGSFFTNPVLRSPDMARVRERAATTLGPEHPAPPEFGGSDGMVKTSAAWLIDKAGFGKGYGMPGPAALSTKHTLALTNRGQASADDVIALAREVRDGVHAAFGVWLVNEPVLVGLNLED